MIQPGETSQEVVRKQGRRMLKWAGIVFLVGLLGGPGWYFAASLSPAGVPARLVRFTTMLLMLAFVTSFAGLCGNGLRRLLTGRAMATTEDQMAAPKWALAVFVLSMLVSTVAAIGLAVGMAFALAWVGEHR